MSFYVTLPSNSSTNLFDNTISNFTTQLHIPIKMSGPYEVALVEFSYDHYWKVNLGKLYYYHSDNLIFDIDIFHRDGDSIENLILSLNDQLNKIIIDHELKKFEEKHVITNEDTLRAGLLKKIGKRSTQDESKSIPFLKFNKLNHQLEINTISNTDTLKFEGIIANILGIDSFLNSFISPVKIDKKYEYGIFIINNIYIYTDIIKYQYIGDTLSPLLRTVNIPSNSIFSTESIIYDSPHYIPINKSSIDTINIKIKDELGNNIKFERGKSIVKLHFRPIFYGF